jgi:uncharacterized protein with PQ loop repeat
MVAINDLPLIAGSASTVIFVTSYMPMLVKAVRTKDLSSYSPTQLVLTNFGNVLYSVHSFYLVATALMLAWYVRYTHRAGRPLGKGDGGRARRGDLLRVLKPTTALNSTG